MFLSEAIRGYLLDAAAGRLSPPTADLYRLYLTRLCDRLGNPPIDSIQPDQLAEFMAWIIHDYKPQRMSGRVHPLSPYAVDNQWKAIRSFFKWADETLQTGRPDKRLPRIKFEAAEVKPFSDDEITRLVKFAQVSRIIHAKNGKRPYTFPRQ